MTVLIFGNEDLHQDSLPLRILPELQKKFPHINFCIQDPNEDFDVGENTIILDAVTGLKEPHVFNGIDDFESPPRVTLHDFDLFGYLHLLRKVGGLPEKIKIVGLPPTIQESQALEFVSKYFEQKRADQ